MYLQKGFTICTDNESFQQCEMMLFDAVFEEKPWFEWVKIRAEEVCATYKVEQVGNKWYIVT